MEHWFLLLVAHKQSVESLPKTDFWSSTFYGFVRHDGHFLHIKVPKEEKVVITTQLTTNPLNQYDQAGLMVRFCDFHSRIRFVIPTTVGSRLRLKTNPTNNSIDWEQW